MAGKRRHLLLDLPSAMQEPIECEQIREWWRTIRQNALGFVCRFAQCHERELEIE